MIGEPILYERYERREAMALFGPDDEAWSPCDGQWVIFPDAAIGFIDVGEPPKESHFTSGGEFCWVAGRRYHVSDDQQIKFVPPEVVSRHADRPIRLFVRPHGSERYRYVGELGPACRFKMSGKDNCGEAYLCLFLRQVVLRPQNAASALTALATGPPCSSYREPEWRGSTNWSATDPA